MKRYLLLIGLLIGLLIAPQSHAADGWFGNLFNRKTVKGSGRIETRTDKVGAFTSVHVARGILAVITAEGEKGVVTVEADDNLMPYVIVRTDGGALQLSIDSEINSISNSHIKISIPDNGRLEALSTSSGAALECTTVLHGTDLRLGSSSGSRLHAAFVGKSCRAESSSGSSMRLNAEVVKLSLSSSSGSKIKARGTADETKISASSGASVEAKNLTSRLADAHASSAGSIGIACTELLSGSASSGASVRYSGRCGIQTRTSSGGSFKRID